jgi:hypothetical protein
VHGGKEAFSRIAPSTVYKSLLELEERSISNDRDFNNLARLTSR